LLGDALPMTQIDFHVNAPSKLNYACRLARKAYGAGARLVVHADDERVLAEFDRLLWTFSSLDFVPHVRVRDRLAPVTPVHLAGPRDLEACLHHDLIVNLGREQPSLFGRFERLIEIVGADDADLAAGRVRWKFYKDRGYPLKRHDVGATA
jgi:DNA polymerase III subunit chi